MEAADGSYRAMQILVKHTESARLASWRDPDGVVIKQRTKDAARGMLHAVLDELSLLPRADLAGAFAEKAREMSDTPGDSIPSHIPSHNSQLLFS